MLKKIAGIAMGALMATTVCAGAVAGAVLNAPESEVPAPTAEAPEEYGAYLFMHFIDAEETAEKEQIYFSVSLNGFNWRPLNSAKPILSVSTSKPEGCTGGVRDPHIIRLHDDDPTDDEEPGYVIIATDLSIYNLGLVHGNEKWTESQIRGSKNIVVWKSNGNSLTDWGEPKLVKVGTDAATCVWAPESVWDNERQAYMVFWASKTGDYDGTHRIYRSYTTDFERFSTPEVYIERDSSRIDTSFYYDEDTGIYYRFTKNENRTYVYMEKSDSLNGNFKEVGSYRIDGQHYTETSGYEGPSVYKLNDGSGYCLLLDNWTYKPFFTSDISTGNFTSGGAFTFGGVRFRHGSVIPIKKSEYDALMKEWGPEQETPTEGDLVYALDFEENLTATDGTKKDLAVTQKGTVTDLVYEDGYKGKALKLNGQQWLQLDGDIVKGLDELTISFAVKADQRSWPFFIAPVEQAQTYLYEKYIGAVMHANSEIGRLDCERYNSNNIARPSQVSIKGLGEDWRFITVVFTAGKTKLYFDGTWAAEITSEVDISDMLGDSPVFQIGKGNWNDGEFPQNMYIDTFRVYNHALTADEVFDSYCAIMEA